MWSILSLDISRSIRLSKKTLPKMRQNQLPIADKEKTPGPCPAVYPPFTSATSSTPQAAIFSASFARTSFLIPPTNLMEPTTR